MISIFQEASSMGVPGIYTYVLSSSRIRHNEYFPLGNGLECSTVSEDVDIIVDTYCCLSYFMRNEVYLEKMLCYDTMYKYIDNMFKWFDYLHFNVKFFIGDGMRPVKKDKTRLDRVNAKYKKAKNMIKNGYKKKNMNCIF